MTAPAAVKLDELLTKTSPEFMPLLRSVLAVSDAASRCNSAAELLRKLVASIEPLYQTPFTLFLNQKQRFWDLRQQLFLLCHHLPTFSIFLNRVTAFHQYL